MSRTTPDICVVQWCVLPFGHQSLCSRVSRPPAEDPMSGVAGQADPATPGGPGGGASPTPGPSTGHTAARPAPPPERCQSGMTVEACKRTDLCDCFDYPEHEHYRTAEVSD